ncbi:hypothetical protein POVWA2_071650 [Plasmodium ovale wallikeri]|uniref:Uncharacterized protein n=1 Tax=Plasmodium ovale wallikeri TaxID=864142 RepID=A0A1A9AJ71_PLAOA|nr:hypothetical protein POVWA1_012900 [Plasmodium ovale wallikeri]SBT56144.1 hypothetical protein POVWA2_071650 [Plasmodium ovale wallikeri]
MLSFIQFYFSNIFFFFSLKKWSRNYEMRESLSGGLEVWCAKARAFLPEVCDFERGSNEQQGCASHNEAVLG